MIKVHKLPPHRFSIMMDLANLIHHGRACGFASQQQVCDIFEMLLHQGNDEEVWFPIECQYAHIRNASEAARPHIGLPEVKAVIGRFATSMVDGGPSDN